MPWCAFRLGIAALAIPALAACGTTTAPGAAPVVGNAGEPPPARAGFPTLYAAMFEHGRSWTFPLVAERRVQDGAGVRRSATAGTITCGVHHPFELPGGWRAEFECRVQAEDVEVLDLSTNGDLERSPSGTYVGTAEGLWEVARFGEDFKNDIDKLDPARMLIDATPALRGPVTSQVASVEVTRVEDVWCATQTYDAGAGAAGWSLCFRDGEGPVGGRSFAWGADTRLASFGEAPRY